MEKSCMSSIQTSRLYHKMSVASHGPLSFVVLRSYEMLLHIFRQEYLVYRLERCQQ